MKSIKTLKKDAKKLRKNNSKIKNQAESLDLIAHQYNENSWRDLLNNSMYPEKKGFDYSREVYNMFFRLNSMTYNKIRMQYSETKRLATENKTDKILNMNLIYVLSDSLHNSSYLFDINSPVDKLKVSVSNHKDIFIIDKGLYKEEEILFLKWIELFDLMLDDINAFESNN